MIKDILYYFDKQTHIRYELGEVQKNFNMSFVIDGTKDSAKLIVFSYEKKTIEPNTIVYHKYTNSWWIVASDKVDRLMSEENYLYMHTLKLEGAIELLNSRDLTDCAFYQDTYTIEDFVKRLFALSTFEYPIVVSRNSYSLDLDEIVDYIKTYENYTLLSALRDFFDGYNSAIKLMFDTTLRNDNVVLDNAILQIISKSGNRNNTLSETFFNDVKETRTINKNSFGTTVVSNADNVSSSRVKTYPIVGTAKLSSKEWEIKSGNAILRLPSNIFDVKKLTMYRATKVIAKLSVYGQEDITQEVVFSSGGKEYFEDMYDKLRITNATYQTFIDDFFDSYKEQLIRLIDAGCRCTLYTGVRYDPTAREPVAPQDNPNFYFPILMSANGINRQKIFLATTDVKNSLENKYQAVAYERGRNYLEGFDFINAYSRIPDYSSTDLKYYEDELYSQTGDRPILCQVNLGPDIYINITIGLTNNRTTNRLIIY